MSKPYHSPRYKFLMALARGYTTRNELAARCQVYGWDFIRLAEALVSDGLLCIDRNRYRPGPLLAFVRQGGDVAWIGKAEVV